MRIAIISRHYSRGMGYIENMLPKHLAALGAEVHLITTRARANPDLPGWDHVSEGADEVRPIVEDRVTIHLSDYKDVLRRRRLTSLRPILQRIKPDIVQVHEANGWLVFDPARLQPVFGYKLFLGAHCTMSIRADIPWWHWSGVRRKAMECLLQRLPNKFACRNVVKCYAATIDCAHVAEHYCGIPRKKISICPLGVDTDLFHAPASELDAGTAAALRAKLGFEKREVVCIYTGKFTAEKNPLILARAITDLQSRNLPFRGLFVGDGIQKAKIESCLGCVAVPFQPHRDLSKFYHSADVGVWPTQESLSMLDAAACGKPIVVNHTVQATERFEGNGLTYRLNDVGDLAAKLIQLQSSELRTKLGKCGAEKVRTSFSWRAIAELRFKDYERSITPAHTS